MTEMVALRQRMDRLERRIAEARDRLLRDARLPDHAATLDELTERYLHAQRDLARETAELEGEGVRVTSFEKTVLDWVNHLTHEK